MNNICGNSGVATKRKLVEVIYNKCIEDYIAVLIVIDMKMGT